MLIEVKIKKIYVFGTLYVLFTYFYLIRVFKKHIPQFMALSKDARIDIRLTKDQKSFFEHVAGLEGLGLTDFVIMAVQKYAKITVAEHETINEILSSKKDQEIFFDILMNPPAPNNALKQAAQHYKKTFK